MDEYPKVKYHPYAAPRVVNSAAEEEALPPGWKNSMAECGIEVSPSEFGPDPKIAEAKKKIPPR